MTEVVGPLVSVHCIGCTLSDPDDIGYGLRFGGERCFLFFFFFGLVFLFVCLFLVFFFFCFCFCLFLFFVCLFVFLNHSFK